MNDIKNNKKNKFIIFQMFFIIKIFIKRKISTIIKNLLYIRRQTLSSIFIFIFTFLYFGRSIRHQKELLILFFLFLLIVLSLAKHSKYFLILYKAHNLIIYYNRFILFFKLAKSR